MDPATEDVTGKIRIGTQARTRQLEKLSGYRARRRISRVELRSAAARRRHIPSPPINELPAGRVCGPLGSITD